MPDYLTDYPIRLVSAYDLIEGNYQTRLDLDFGGERIVVSHVTDPDQPVTAWHVAGLLRALAERLAPSK